MTPAPFTAVEASLLRRAWSGLWPVAKIVAELAPRRPVEILRQIDLMLARPSPSPDGEWAELERALLALPGRVERVRRCPLGFRLDGRPASMAQVVAAANAFLTGMGYEPIRYPRARGAQDGTDGGDAAGANGVRTAVHPGAC